MAAAIAAGATAITGVGATWVTLAARPTRTRSPARSISISVRLVSSSSLASSRIRLDAGDRRQVERDVQSLRARLDAIPREIAAEQDAIARRYAEPTHRLFPAAVTLLVPEGARL